MRNLCGQRLKYIKSKQPSDNDKVALHDFIELENSEPLHTQKRCPLILSCFVSSVILSLSLSFCTSTSSTVSQPANQRESTAAAVESPLFFLEIKSPLIDETSQEGRLLLRGRPVPAFFNYIEDTECAFTCYDFKKDKHLSLYRKIPKKKLKNNQIELSKMDHERGYYLGSERKSDALPGEWIYAEWEGGSAYFYSESFLDIIERDPFIAIFRK